jgi:glycosyltransferase involved in cell wall biosynthesis
MIRVLHVVESFNGQAVESWLSRLLLYDRFDHARFHFDFFLLGVGEGGEANRIRGKGSKIIFGNPGEASIPQMAAALRRQVRRGGYDVVHVHQDVLGGVFALALLGTGVKIVTHVHNCWQRLPVGGRLRERVLTSIAARLTLKLSSAIVGVSNQALQTLTGGKRKERRIDSVIYCSAKFRGIAVNETERALISVAVRNQYRLPTPANILLFLGRLDEYKNPVFAFEVLREMVAKGNADACLVIAGSGGLEQQVRELAEHHGLQEHVRLVGWVDDPERLLLASDILLMPSQESCGEGLGLSAVEAQGCGLPVLCSMSIPEDAAIIPDLVKRVSLGSGVGKWAEAANHLLTQGKQEIGFYGAVLEQSAFTDCESLRRLNELYERCLS